MFHQKNPSVWGLFKGFSARLLRAGLKRYSADAVFHRIRWHVDVETEGEPVKLNDHYTAYYARMLEASDERFVGFFRKRHRSSKNKQERPDAMLFGKNAEEVDDARLVNELRELAKL
jgi:hypothetical protein